MRRKHWYFISEIYCPICMSSKVYRERRYGRKPKVWSKTHETVETWDYCGAL